MRQGFWPYLGKRLLISIWVALGVSAFVFLIIHLVPGDPVRVMLGLQASNAEVARIRRLMGFDRPLYVQYWRWLVALLHGNLGKSYLTEIPVIQLILQRLPRTLSLSAAALFISLVIAVPSGIFAAARPNSLLSYVVTFFTQLGIAIPDFWLGVLMILMFAVWLRWLPPSGYVSPGRDFAGWLQHLILPALTVGLVNAAVLTRFVRSSVIEVLGEDYVRTARSKGVAERRILYRHALRNAAIPIVTVIALQTAFLLGGVIIIEVIFAWPGLGRLAVTAIFDRDYPVVQGSVLLEALIFVAVNLIADLTYALIDPRIKY